MPIRSTSRSRLGRDDLAVILLDRPVEGVPVLPTASSRPSPGTAISTFAHDNTGKAVDFEGPGYRDDTLHRGDLTVISHADRVSGCGLHVSERYRRNVCAHDGAVPP